MAYHPARPREYVSKMQIASGIIFLIAVVTIASVLTAMAVASIRRGRTRHGTSGTLSSGMLEIQALLEPAKRHVVIAAKREAADAEEDASGEP